MTGLSQVIVNIRSTFYIVDRELSNKLARLRQFVDVHVATTAVNLLLLFFCFSYIIQHQSFKLFTVTQELISSAGSLIVTVCKSLTDTRHTSGGNLLND
jgi:hypothetical protein